MNLKRRTVFTDKRGNTVDGNLRRRDTQIQLPISVAPLIGDSGENTIICSMASSKAKNTATEPTADTAKPYFFSLSASGIKAAVKSREIQIGV